MLKVLKYALHWQNRPLNSIEHTETCQTVIQMEDWISRLLYTERNVHLNKSLRFLWIKGKSKALDESVKSLYSILFCHNYTLKWENGNTTEAFH